MPAALLLLLCLSCNNNVQKDKVASLSRQIKEEEQKAGAPGVDHEAGMSYKTDSTALAEPPTTGVANTAGLPGEQSDAPPHPTPRGGPLRPPPPHPPTGPTPPHASRQNNK